MSPEKNPYTADTAETGKDTFWEAKKTDFYTVFLSKTSRFFKKKKMLSAGFSAVGSQTPPHLLANFSDKTASFF